MENEYIDLINGGFHICLLLMNLLLLIVFVKRLESVKAPNKKEMIIYNKPTVLLMIFIIFYIYSETYFLRYFYENIDFYLYEFIAMSEQIIFLGLFIYNFLKGDKKDGN